jgi:hypothetical protein
VARWMPNFCTAAGASFCCIVPNRVFLTGERVGVIRGFYRSPQAEVFDALLCHQHRISRAMKRR